MNKCKKQCRQHDGSMVFLVVFMYSLKEHSPRPSIKTFVLSLLTLGFYQWPFYSKDDTINKIPLNELLTKREDCE